METLKMPISWAPEKVSQLSLQDVITLSENAKIRGGEEVFALCQSEIQARKIESNATTRSSDGLNE